jgi:acyl-CoA hydrolase
MFSSINSVKQKAREITLRFLAEPTDVNFGGKVHGGAVMKWIDQAGYACAVGWSGYYCVTVYVGGIRFYKPIFIGQIVEVSAKVVHTGTSSMHIAVDVSATDPKTGDRKTTTRCLIVFVAVDGGGDTVTVPAWHPETEEDKRLEQYAVRMAQARKDQENEILAAAPA